MRKIREFFAKIAGFVKDVGVELKKSEWPTRQELTGSTVVVIVSVILLGIFIGLSDFVLIKVLKLLVKGY